MYVRLVNETLSELIKLVNKPMFIECHGNLWDLYANINGESTHIASGFKQDLVYYLQQFIAIAKLTKGLNV